MPVIRYAPSGDCYCLSLIDREFEAIQGITMAIHYDLATSAIRHESLFCCALHRYWSPPSLVCVFCILRINIREYRMS